MSSRDVDNLPVVQQYLATFQEYSVKYVGYH